MNCVDEKPLILIVKSSTPFTNDYPHADIHKLLSLDILHQIIKGTFKDHLEHGKTHAKEILDNIDCCIAAAPSFAGLHRFPEGRGFSQWTGDDLKALMKVYLPAIEGLVPQDIVQCFHAFLEFCYIYQKFFKDMGVWINRFSLPRQHSLSHYILLVHMFGAPNGLCSSITESKHIKAVKEPWQQSSKFNALGQMLLTNQCLDKIAASRVDFTAHKMLTVGHLHASFFYSHDTRYLHSNITPNTSNDTQNVGDDNGEDENDNDDMRRDPLDPIVVEYDKAGDGVVEGSKAQSDVKLAQHSRAGNIRALAIEMDIPNLPHLVRLFLYDQFLASDTHTLDDVPLSACPRFEGPIKVFNSAAATFFAPSDPSGIGGMHHEYIHVALSWQRGPPRYDTVFINTASKDSINGMEVGQVLCFFLFSHSGETFPCTLIHWFKLIDNKPDPDTGMWISAAAVCFHAKRAIGVILSHTTHSIPACAPCTLSRA
ncbi:hypothetical protein DFJ58DRAFT_716682 [Suillus subalutaceus]|uniref:uncharacterized protein n=1 Tax=Suillus subalutaceus TaxID=48586 RepID=UPI001B872454|nr:uncharacterized protein DFJ58DRAFT_716682 [Suillus subalutaceus]KAG1851631.1 hypothetical protein DFJ58DRAFT_716682 [Suillus subalutaceus]